MKKIILSLAVTFAVGVLFGQEHGLPAGPREVAGPQESELPRHLDPSVVSIGKELPRGEVISHDSREQAVRRSYHSSKYLQPLAEWTTAETADAVVWKTHFKIPFEWIDRRQFLYLGKVSGSFDVMVNGKLAGYSQTGSTPSEFDITGAAREGANDLEIVIYKNPASARLENSRPPALAPQIEGEAYVLSQPRMRVRDIFVSTRMEGTEGLLELGVIMKSHQLNAKDYTVYWELLSPMGEILAEGYKDAALDMRREDTVHFFSKIRDIVPWSHEEPRLYTLMIKTRHEGRFKEYLSFRVGFRSIEVTDGLVRLNGVPLRLSIKDFAPDTDAEQMLRQLEALRAEGINTLKLTGAPPSHEFYELCDRTGMYLAGEADIDTHLAGKSRKTGGNPSNDPVWEGAYLDRVMSMYHTSKNSPSMVMFSLAEKSANGYNLYESYVALKEVEKHRPILYTDGDGEWNTDLLDVATMETLPHRSGGNMVELTAEDAAEGRFRIHNTRYITPLTGEAIYKTMVGKKVVSQGMVPIEVMPQQTGSFTIPIVGVKEGKQFTVRIEIAVENPEGDYLPEGDPNRRVLRDARDALPETGRLVVESGEFPSGRGFATATAAAAETATP